MERKDARHEYYSHYADQLERKLESGQLEELQAYRQFCVWEYRTLPNGRKTKPPINPHTGQLADSTDPSTWGTWVQATQAVRDGKGQGIGFVLTEHDPFVAIDLDHSLGHDKKPVEAAQKVVTALSSYTEVSPSGNGLHVLLRTENSFPGRRNDQIEIYSKERYITLTLNHLQGTPTTINERPLELQMLLAEYFPEPTPIPVFQKPVAEVQQQEQKPRLENSQLEEHMQKYPHSVLSRLYQGDKTLYEGEKRRYRSKSEADAAFCLMLLGIADDDLTKAEQLYLQSGMVDAKTLSFRGEETYLQYTLRRMLERRIYKPQK